MVLSCKWEGYKHFKILVDNERYKLEGKLYETITELIQDYFENKIQVTARSNVILKRPIMKQKWLLSSDEIIYVKPLGKGQLGEVFQGRALINDTWMDVAVKTCQDDISEVDKKKFIDEARIMRRFNHPSVVKLLAVAATTAPLMIVMELVTGGELLTYLQINRSRLTLQQKLKFSLDAANGMEYLASNKCIHRDLAARNCLLSSENSVKISDFGMSRDGEEYLLDPQRRIPLKWSAYESIKFKQYTPKSDVWSFGILMWEIFSGGEVPYTGWSGATAAIQVVEGYRMKPPEDTPPEIGRLMLSTWEKDDSKRPTFSELREELERSCRKHGAN